jgi:hypothetical protein
MISGSFDWLFIDMSSQSLSSRLQALLDTYKHTLDLIQRLQKLATNPGSGSPDADPRIELASEIHQRLREQEDALEILRQEADDGVAESGPVGGRWVGGGSVMRRRESEREQERERAAATMARLGEDLKAYVLCPSRNYLPLKNPFIEHEHPSDEPNYKRSEMPILLKGRSEKCCSPTGLRT